MNPIAPARRLALLEEMLTLRARRAVPAGSEALHAGVRLALDGRDLQPEGSALPAGDRVGAVFFTDKARLHEIALLADERPLPLLCLCENSPWASFSARSGWLALDSRAVDGHDVEAIHAAATMLAAASARDGRPRLLELLVAHPEAGEHGPAGAEESGAWMPCDPITLQTSRLLGEQVVGAGELMVLYQRVAALAPVAPVAPVAPAPTRDVGSDCVPA